MLSSWGDLPVSLQSIGHGQLSGKYFSPCGGPPDARMNLFRGKYSEGQFRYNLSNASIKSATLEYIDIADILFHLQL
ncbi:hypothetical protein AQUCO_02600104v1 [Aquilegia coerulea]|uniref:Uncharacterized protein n=1 Tax=Aquilegia coerulea TaxID=218851 RepID=A0A2G5D7C6_AQUCA|nr:hypothetical protein AQUCO_02600104v1 [Aquilegia coerulea]